jgi:hypothetical protein
VAHTRNATRINRRDKIVATGTWFYDRSVPHPIAIYAKPARFASSRYDDLELDERRPIPDTKDGFLYYCWPGLGEHLTIEEAKAWADAQPWGPIKWD